MRHFEVRRSLSHDTCILHGRSIDDFKANCTISRTLRVSWNWPARSAQYRSIFMTVVPYMARIEANPPRICTLYCTVTGSYDSCPQMEVTAVEIQQSNRGQKSISSSPQNLRENQPTTRLGSWVKTINRLHTSSSTARGRVCVLETDRNPNLWYLPKPNIMLNAKYSANCRIIGCRIVPTQ